jgi:hypothetical protein
MQCLDAPEMLPKWPSHQLGNHADPVRAAFPAPDGQLAARQVEILDPQHEALGQPQPAAIEQQADQAMGARKKAKDRRHLLPREHHRQRGRHPPARQPPQLLERSAHDVPIKKEERAEHLLLGGRGEPSLDRQVSQELPDLRRARFGRVPEIAEPDKSPGPVDIGSFRALAQMLEAQIGMQRLQQGRLVLHSGPPEVDPHTFVSTTPAAGINPAPAPGSGDGESRGSSPRPAPRLSELGGP